MNESKRLNLLCLRRVATPRFCFADAMIRLSEWRPKMCFEFPEREYHRVFKRKGTAQKSRMEVNSTRRPVSSCFASCFAPFPLLSSCFGQKCVLFCPVLTTLFQNILHLQVRHRHIVMHGVQPRILQPLEDFFFVFVHGRGWLVVNDLSQQR